MIYRVLVNEEILLSVETFTNEVQNWTNRTLNIINYIKNNEIEKYQIEGRGYKTMTLFTEQDIYIDIILKNFCMLQRLMLRLYPIKKLSELVKSRAHYKEYEKLIKEYQSENGRTNYFYGNYTHYDKLIERFIYLDIENAKTEKGKENVSKCLKYFVENRDYIENEIISKVLDIQSDIIDLDITTDKCLLSIVISEEAYTIDKLIKAKNKILELNQKEFNEFEYIFKFKKYFNNNYQYENPRFYFDNTKTDMNLNI